MIKKDPLVTIYITNYNYGKYLQKSIESVLNQTFKNFELIIIDDGSTDSSKSIISKFKNNSKIRVVYQKNKGLNQSNNLALKISKGRFIIRLDADDWLDIRALEILVNAIKKDNEIGLVFPDYYEVDEEGEIINIIRRHDFSKVTLHDQAAHGACTLIRKSFLQKMGGYDKTFFCQDGYDLWIKFIDKYKIKNINLPLFYYRQHTNSLSKNTNKILKTRSEIIRKKFKKTKIKKNKAIAVIPVRGLKINPKSYVMTKIVKKPLLFWSIDTLLKSKRISKVIVTTPDENIIKKLKEKYKNKIFIIKREEEKAGINIPINQTINDAVKKAKKRNINFHYIFEISYKNPFFNIRDIETSINMMEIFNTDQVIGVVPERDSFFQHDGNGLKPLRNFSQLRLERDELFRDPGFLRLVKKKYLSNSNKSIKKIGHLIIDEKTSFTINSNTDLLIAEKIYSKNKYL